MAKAKTFILERTQNGLCYWLCAKNGKLLRTFCVEPFERQFPDCKLQKGERRKVEITMKLKK